ncbi:hypothetical protein SDC9_72644 [bioreactor metagenome]|uniref:Uncharacterized protein n=1 Tax=bioreactor metagenome TaxID=1076179 RepID=A0A644YI33_9ZZZZ
MVGSSEDGVALLEGAHDHPSQGIDHHEPKETDDDVIEHR